MGVAGAETGLDRIVVNGLGGTDVVEASTLPASMPIVADGGTGDNVLLGGETIVNGRALSRKWLAQNARTVDGSTEIDLGRKRLVVRGIPLDVLQGAVG